MKLHFLSLSLLHKQSWFLIHSLVIWRRRLAAARRTARTESSDPGVENDGQLRRLNYLLTVTTLARRRRRPNGTFYPLPSATGKEPI